jgi:predicted nucleic-acid-binding Zn-ribbon protein
MRSTQTCPKCSGRKFAVNEVFRQAPTPHSTDTRPFRAITIDRAKPHNDTYLATGYVESWICLGCGYMELYAYQIEHLKALAAEHPDQLRIVDAGAPEQGPYR